MWSSLAREEHNMSRRWGSTSRKSFTPPGQTCRRKVLYRSATVEKLLFSIRRLQTVGVHKSIEMKNSSDSGIILASVLNARLSSRACLSAKVQKTYQHQSSLLLASHESGRSMVMVVSGGICAALQALGGLACLRGGGFGVVRCGVPALILWISENRALFVHTGHARPHAAPKRSRRCSAPLKTTLHFQAGARKAATDTLTKRPHQRQRDETLQAARRRRAHLTFL